MKPTQQTLAESTRIEVPLTGDQPDWVTLVPGIGLAYESGHAGGQKHIYLYNTTTKKQSVIADLPLGGLTWLSASSRYLAWGQQAEVQQNPTAKVAWKMYFYDLQTSKASLLGEGVSTLPPLPRLFNNTVYWAQFLGFRVKAADLWKQNLKTGRRSRVLTQVRTGQTAANADVLVYNLTEQFHPGRHTYRADLYALFKGDPDPVRLTHLGNTDQPTIDHNTLAFRDGLSGRIAALELPDGDPVVLAGGDQGFLTAGDGFVADLAHGPLGQTVRIIQVSDPMHTPDYLTLPPQTHVCVPCGISVTGNQVAWGVQKVDPNGVYGQSIAIISTFSQP